MLDKNGGQDLRGSTHFAVFDQEHRQTGLGGGQRSSINTIYIRNLAVATEGVLRSNLTRTKFVIAGIYRPTDFPIPP